MRFHFTPEQTSRWNIYTEIAKRMDARLQAVKMTPQNILCLGADFNQSIQLLSKRYPKAKFTEVDPDAGFLEYSSVLRQHQQTIWHKLFPNSVIQKQRTLSSPSELQKSAQMIWSNLNLHLIPEPAKAFSNWSELLAEEGMLFMSSFGPDTGKEIISFLKDHQIELPRNPFPDMHDLGDSLFANGFSEPVMDMEKITLTYKHPHSFWQDLRIMRLLTMALLEATQKFKASRLINQAISENKLNHITLEIVYGHALKKRKQDTTQHIVTFHSKNK